PKEYARPGLDKHRLGELIDRIGTIVLIRTASGEEIAKADLPPDAGAGAAEGKVETPSLPSHRSVDLLGRVYEYFLTRFASAEGNRAISTLEVLEELIKLAKELDAATKRGIDLGLTDDEVAFYDALAANESAVKAMG